MTESLYLTDVLELIIRDKLWKACNINGFSLVMSRDAVKVKSYQSHCETYIYVHTYTTT